MQQRTTAHTPKQTGARQVTARRSCTRPIARRLPGAACSPRCSLPPPHPPASPRSDVLHGVLTSAVALTTTLAIATASWSATPTPSPHQLPDYDQVVHTHPALEYERVVKKRRSIKSSLPSSDQSAVLMELYRDIYDDDALKGMVRLTEYAAFVEELEERGVETAAGCEQCEANRIILENAWQVVANQFYDPSARFSQAEWGGALLDAIKGAGGALHSKRELYQAAGQMVGALGDPYSEFMPPSQFRRALRRPLPAERNYLAAQYVGVGVHLGETSPLGGRMVDAPLAGSPAEAAGIVRGDRILDIEGVSADGVTMEQAVALMRGPEGSSTPITVAPASGPPVRMELERRRLPQPAVRAATLAGPDGGVVGYLRMFYFSSETTRAMVQALSSWEEAGLQGYIIDLRNNPGGTFEEAIAMAADLLPEGRVVTETVRSDTDAIDTSFQVGKLSWEVFGPPRAAPLTSAPLVVLVNSASASASEVLAGALRDNGRAVLIGERTFGKGVMQYYFPMADGSGLKLTVAKYLSPRGFDISRRGGLPPDIACHDFPRGVLDSSGGAPDSCVQMALDVLNPAVQRSNRS